MMSVSTRRIGMIGAGWVTGYHLPAWGRQRHRAKVVAIADPSAAATAQRAAEFGIPGSYASAEAMLAAEELDAVDICSPRETHAAMVRLAAARQLDILCQKPLGTDFAEAEAVVAGVAPPTRLMVHENWRFRAYYRVLKRWLDEGAAGEIRQVNFEFLSSGMLAGPDGLRPALVRQPFFRTQPRLLVMEVLIHHLDTLRYLLGELEVVAARLERSNAEIVAEDVAAVVLRRPSDGLVVNVTGNLAVAGAPPAPRDHLRIFGTRGTVELKGATLRLEAAVPRAEDFDPDATYQGSYDAAIGHFLDGLDTGKPFETAPEDNLRTLRLVEEIYRLSRFDPAAEPR
ncbi:Gfo/Idh/MocA family oxidoreductase [Devosia sp. Root105]|uniref:Gfo/Idh/MocA family protein n=1 Tax=Devosia sp. Root105 TaxID=1736423 RepID=UPI0006FBE62D|nr:Gfo/Idh/MocA family oxidoreductase [Devosia sp. Root105]KQU95221.1 inositol 2-dehydrogenase [Devosia sp. Root105]